MLFQDLFLKPTFMDQKFRMVFPLSGKKRYSLFSKYADAVDYKRVEQHIYIPVTPNPEIDDYILDFTTEGRWFCMLNHPKNGLRATRLAFELEADYAMMRLFGFGE